MPFFVDTNIPLGYTVIHDKWHENSYNFIKNNDNIFWSNLVKDEYTNKLDDILDDIDIFLKTTENLLKNNTNDFLNYYTFEKYVLERTKNCHLDKIKKQKILKNFWNKNNFFEGISEVLYFKFKNFNKNFKKMYLKNDAELNNTLVLHDCGLDNYMKYLDYAMQLKEWGIHPPDCKIITDAHDLGLHHDNLIFVTADVKLLEKIAGHDTSFLKIIKFQSCT